MYCARLSVAHLSAWFRAFLEKNESKSTQETNAPLSTQPDFIVSWGFFKIGPDVTIISHPVTVIKMGRAIQAFLDVSKDSDKGCKEEKFDEFGVYVINELNSVINIIDKPEISIDKGLLTIKNELNSLTLIHNKCAFSNILLNYFIINYCY